MQVTTTKFDILGHEFTLDELNNIAKHGMPAGVNGFIYSSELHDSYQEHEDDILNELDKQAEDQGVQSGMQMVVNAVTKGDETHFYTMQCLKEMAVWMYVEMTAHDLLLSNNHPDWV